ncbi:MAG TPA: NAD-dependent epimerase/dehydratase family protein, partial [Thiobacillus sp.]|nr:NAD-dependent epimerase/dehydratase family protein [Thiobacillus sp.]
MHNQAKIYIAGHRGLVGTALMRNLRAKGFDNFVTRTHAELDLTSQAAVDAFFAAEKPD